MLFFSIKQISNLQNRNNALILSNKAKRLLTYLEVNPIINIKKPLLALNLSYNTIASAIEELINEGILAEITKQSRNGVFAYKEYLNILKRDIE